MKAVLIIDMPENCRNCDFFGFTCKLTKTRCNYSDEGRNEDCPLQPIEKVYAEMEKDRAAGEMTFCYLDTPCPYQNP